MQIEKFIYKKSYAYANKNVHMQMPIKTCVLYLHCRYVTFLFIDPRTF